MFKIYVKNVNGEKLKIFVDNGDPTKPLIDYYMAETSYQANYIRSVLQSAVDSANESNQGTLVNCTVHVVPQ